MRLFVRSAAFFAVAVVVLLWASPVDAQSWTIKPLSDGVRLIQQVDAAEEAPLIVSALKLDPKRPGVSVKAALGRDKVMDADPTRGRETVSALVQRRNALAAINADYFDWTGDPLGLAIVDGELVSEPFAGRAVFGLTATGEAILDSLTFAGYITTADGQGRSVNGLNRPRGHNQMILYSPTFGESTGTDMSKTNNSVEAVLVGANLPVRTNREMTARVQSISDCTNTTIPRDALVLSGSGIAAEWMKESLRVGESVILWFQLNSANGHDWRNVEQAVGGGPWLVKDRQVHITAQQEGFNRTISDLRHPRTAVGVTSEGELLFVAIDGRQSISRGATLAETASIMQRLGAINAINLDGGGSTAMSLRGSVTNSPSGGQERPVASMLIVSAPPAPGDLRFKFADDDLEIISGQPARPELVEESTGVALDVKAAQNIVWGTTGGIGFVSQEGRFIPIKAGTGSIVAMLGDVKAELPVTVKPGAPVRIDAKIEPDISGAINRSQILVKILDANGNAIPEHGFRLSGKQAIVDAPLGVTDSKGEGLMGVTWELTRGGVVTITVGDVVREIRQPEPPAESSRDSLSLPISLTDLDAVAIISARMNWL